MSNVIIDKSKIDILANAISVKSGEPVTMTLDEMVEAVDGIETGGGGITPTGNIDITSAGVTDVTNYATATVAEGEVFPNFTERYTTISGSRKWEYIPKAWIVTGDDEGTPGYISDGSTFSGTTRTYNAIAKNTSVTPTESSQTIGGADYMMEGAVTVNAIPSNYVGSGITRRDSTDLSASGATVSVPSGYYESNASKAVASGTEGTPTATKGTVSNHSVAVTPSVTNTTGYITGSTKTGTAVTVSASELVSGTYTVDSSGTKDVTNYASASVPSGSVTAPSTITGTSATVSTGTNTLTLSKTVSVTPSVTTAGYVSSGTAGNSSVSLTASVTTKGATTYRASTTQQTISSGTYLTGTQTIAPVSQTNLTAENIKSGTTISISDGANNIWSVTGTYSGGGGTSKNVQVLQSTSRTNSSSLTKVLGDLTVSKTGTYDVYWSGGRTNTSTSYTWGTRLYVDGSGYGTENTSWSNNCQSNHLSNVSLTANQKLSVYARGRTGSYYTFAPMLVIIEA